MRRPASAERLDLFKKRTPRFLAGVVESPFVNIEQAHEAPGISLTEGNYTD